MDYRRVAAQLRVKAAASGTTPDEAATLLAKARELETKYGPAVTPPDAPKHTYAPPAPWTVRTIVIPAREYDIVEESYRWAPEDD